MDTNHILKSMLTDESRQQKGDSSAEHIERHAEVVKEVKRRDEHEKMVF